jgi:hypothetical protein
MAELTFSDLRKKDYKKVVELAIKGMNFRWYLKRRLSLKMYGKYFLYLELSKASQVIACYRGEELAGLLLADMKGERKFKLSPFKRLHVRFIDFIQHAFAKDRWGLTTTPIERCWISTKEAMTPMAKSAFWPRIRIWT